MLWLAFRVPVIKILPHLAFYTSLKSEYFGVSFVFFQALPFVVPKTPMFRNYRTLIYVHIGVSEQRHIGITYKIALSLCVVGARGYAVG
jgi:hypothetical protein